MRVLIVEDSPARIKAFRRELIGHSVTWANSASLGAQMLAKEQFDLLLLDYDLDQEGDPQAGKGIQVVAWLAHHRDRIPPRVAIHSLNPFGGAGMQVLLGKIGVKAPWIPFLWEKPADLEGLLSVAG